MYTQNTVLFMQLRYCLSVSVIIQFWWYVSTVTIHILIIYKLYKNHLHLHTGSESYYKKKKTFQRIKVLLREKDKLIILEEAITGKPQGFSSLSSSTLTHLGTVGGTFYFLYFHQHSGSFIKPQTPKHVQQLEGKVIVITEWSALQVPATRLKSLSLSHSWWTERITVNS